MVAGKLARVFLLRRKIFGSCFEFDGLFVAVFRLLETWLSPFLFLTFHEGLLAKPWPWWAFVELFLFNTLRRDKVGSPWDTVGL